MSLIREGRKHTGGGVDDEPGVSSSLQEMMYVRALNNERFIETREPLFLLNRKIIIKNVLRYLIMQRNIQTQKERLNQITTDAR